jgi:pimeloyl-ACP methyl ester carboxylesterase
MKKTRIIVFLLISLIALFFIYSHFSSFKKDEIYSTKGGKFFYSEKREVPKYQIIPKYKNESLEVFSVKFRSRDFLNYTTFVYGLLFMPQQGENLPGIVLLPGGGGTKEGETNFASFIAKKGYAVLTIDQRGIGETGGYYLNVDEDYKVFSRGQEPVQHLAVYDVLASFDVLGDIKRIDKENIALIGKSMGGRYALIAAAIDRRIKGVLAISSSGFNIKKDSSPYNSYLLSIDPDNYVGDIAPRQVIFFSSKNDTIVPLAYVKNTYDIAGNPKELYIVDNCSHGYCDAMQQDLNKSLKEVFGV